MLADENAFELARSCREALNQEVYGGLEPGDSRALSEVWPTRAGRAFTIGYRDREYAVIIVPADADVPARLINAEYEPRT